MTIFDFLLSDPGVASFPEVAITAEFFPLRHRFGGDTSPAGRGKRRRRGVAW